MDAITESLLENSKSAIMSCIEIHNKPSFSYRYEVCSILAINGWELILKAYINENCPEIKIINKKGESKPFLDCVEIVSNKKGKSFRAKEESLKTLYSYRCQIIHFYKDNLDAIIFSLLHTAIIFYNDFSKECFNIDLSENSNLILLPIGFKPIISPIDFLSNKSTIDNSSLFVRNFIDEIIVSTRQLVNEGVDEGIVTIFNVGVFNEKRISNADIIAGITSNEAESNLSVSNLILDSVITDDVEAKKIRVETGSLLKTKFMFSHNDVTNKCRELFSDFKQNAKFNRIMKSIKLNPDYCFKHYLDPINKTGIGRDYYSIGVFDELAKYYTRSQ